MQEIRSDRVPEEPWKDLCDSGRRQGSRPSLRKRNAKWLPEEALQILTKKRSERQRRKGKIYPFECRVPKNSKER